MGTTTISRRSVPPPRHPDSIVLAPSRRPSRGWMWAVPAVCMIAVVSIGIGLIALTRIPSTTALTTQITTLHRQVGALHAQAGGLERALAREQRLGRASRSAIGGLQKKWQTAATSAQVDGVSAGVHQAEACTAEVARAVSGLAIRTTAIKGWLRGASLASSAGISPGCA